MPASAAATAERIKDANTRYHDVAADSYDSKWGIDFGAIGQAQVAAKLAKALDGLPERPFEAALEIGAGTGYFSLNLAQLGLIERATASDISPRMLAILRGSADRLGIEIETAVADAERLPFEDRSFDLVFGHAVLHHLPDLSRALAELHRVLRPGGTLAFCGEPSRHGDRISALPKRIGVLAGPAWRRLVGASPARWITERSTGDGHELEYEVDVHAFTPATLREHLRAAGFGSVRIRGEELLANAHGWLVRTLEAGAEPDEVPIGWRNFAFRSYIALQRIDSSLLEPRLPPELFYNLVLSARRPAG